MSDTRQRLLDGTLVTLRSRGIAGISARTIAATAGVNQSLVFYHFGSVDRLIDAACREGSADLVATYRAAFSQVHSLRDLLALGRRLHTAERQQGNVAVMAQVLAGAQQEPALVEAGRVPMTLWIAEIEPVLRRVLAGSAVADVLDVPGLARAVAASFVGLELYEGVDPSGAEDALAALEQLAVLMEVVEDLGPVARRALRGRVRRAGAR